MGPEAKLYRKFKKATPTISYSRIENLALPGVPDTLCYNKYNTFFTVEFKVRKSQQGKAKSTSNCMAYAPSVQYFHLHRGPRSGHRETL